MATAIPKNEAGFTLGELAAVSGGRCAPSQAAVAVRGVVTDSRAVAPGNLYVALRGEHHDGHAFLPQAQAAGAAAVLVEREQGLPDELPRVVVSDARRALGEIARAHRVRWGRPVVAITGSAGKTTTKELTAAALRSLGQSVLSTQGNLNNDVGLPMTLLCLTEAHTLAVVELGTGGPGEIAWLSHVAAPEVGVVTTVSLAHTERLGSLDAVAEEKCALLRALPETGTAIYGADSELLRARVASFGADRKLGYGEVEGAQLHLLQSALRADLTTQVRYAFGGATRGFELRLSGKAPALDALAALAVVAALRGADALAAAAAALRDVQPLPGRLQPRPTPRGALVIDDTYNANPASMASSLRTLAELAKVRGGRSVAVLADMAELGTHAHVEHARIGALVVELALSEVYFCGPEMAGAASAARQQVRKVRAKGPHVQHFDDALACIADLGRSLANRDAVLVKGSRALAMERVVDALCPAQETGA